MKNYTAFKKIVLILVLLAGSVAYTDEKKEIPPTEQSQGATGLQAAPVLPQPAPQNPPALPSSEEMTQSYEGAFVRMIITLLGILLLVFGTFWILRRLGGGKLKLGSGRLINVIEKRALSPKSVLYIVEVGNKKVLISESQAEVRALTTLEEIPEA